MQGILHSATASTSSSLPYPLSRPFITSPGGLFRIYGYTPQQGVAGTAIVAHVEFSHVGADTTFLRIVVGNCALGTKIKQARSGLINEWELEAVIPALEVTGSSSLTVFVTVQALTRSDVMLDSLTFGKFTYAQCPGSSGTPESPSPNLKDFIVGTSCAPRTARNAPRATTANGTARTRTLTATMGAKDARSSRRHLKQPLTRCARRYGSDDEDAGDQGQDWSHSAFRAVLQLDVPTDRMARVEEWNVEELREGRRLVRFTHVRDGSTLHVSCEAISPAEYIDGDTVVSCIYRPEEVREEVQGDEGDEEGTEKGKKKGSNRVPTTQCCITSVDIIFLLECLIGDLFIVEEKNRIRRNLEEFDPQTVSKTKKGTRTFFRKLMEFPAPQPWNIAKSLKVFDWATLPEALEKLVSRYTLYPTIRKLARRQPTVTESVDASLLPSPEAHITSTTPDRTPSCSLFPLDVYYRPTYSNTQYQSATSDRLEGSSGNTTSYPYDTFKVNAEAPSPIPTPSMSGAGASVSSASTYDTGVVSTAYPSASQSQPFYQTTYQESSPYGLNMSAQAPFLTDYERASMSSSPYECQTFLSD